MYFGGVEKHLGLLQKEKEKEIGSVEAVNGASLTLQRVDDIQRGHRLSARVFGVGHGVFDDILEERLDDGARLFVDLARNALHSAATRQATDRRLGDARNVAFAAFAKALGATLAQSLASFAAARHAAAAAVLEKGSRTRFKG